MCTHTANGAPAHRRNISVSSDVSEYHDAHCDLVLPDVAEHDQQAQGVVWDDEEQMLPPNDRPLAERVQLIHSMRKIVLSEPDTGVGLPQRRHSTGDLLPPLAARP